MGDIRFTIRPEHDKPNDSGSVFDFSVLGNYLGFVLKSALRHKLLFFMCFLALATSAAALARIIPNRYQVEATVLVQRGGVMSIFSNPGVNRDWDLPTRAAREVVVRRDNLIALCRKTDFLRRHLASQTPLILARNRLMTLLRGKPEDEEAQLRGIIDGIERKLWVVVGNEGTVTITFVWSDPSLTYDYVEAALQSFLEARHAAEITQVSETVAILQEHDQQIQHKAQELAGELDEKEKALKGRVVSRRPAPVVAAVDPGADAQAQVQAQAQAQAHLLETRLTAKQRALSDLEEFRRRRLDELQAKLTEVLHVYAPEHPQVIELKKSIESISGSSPQVDQLRAEVVDLEAQLRHLSPIRSATPAFTATPAPIDFPPLPLLDDPRLDYERSLLTELLRQHASLVERIDAARMEIDTAEAGFKYRYSVVSPPQMPRGPLRPYALIVVVVGVLGGIAFAFFATTVADLLRGRVLERWQVERDIGLSIIAEVDR